MVAIDLCGNLMFRVIVGWSLRRCVLYTLPKQIQIFACIYTKPRMQSSWCTNYDRSLCNLGAFLPATVDFLPAVVRFNGRCCLPRPIAKCVFCNGECGAYGMTLSTRSFQTLISYLNVSAWKLPEHMIEQSTRAHTKPCIIFPFFTAGPLSDH